MSRLSGIVILQSTKYSITPTIGHGVIVAKSTIELNGGCDDLRGWTTGLRSHVAHSTPKAKQSGACRKISTDTCVDVTGTARACIMSTYYGQNAPRCIRTGQMP